MAETWITVREAADLLGITRQSVNRLRRDGEFESRQAIGRGGRQYQILLESLPSEAVQRYYAENADEQVSETEFSDADVDAMVYQRAPKWAREQADKYLTLIQHSEGLRGQKLKVWIKSWNKENPELKTSYSRLMAARREYREDGVAGLLARYGKTAGSSVVDDDHFEHFKSLYLKEGGPSVRSCWIYTLGYARQQNPSLNVDEFPNHTTFLRRLRREIPEQAIYLARHGHAAWNRKYANYIARDYSTVEAGAVWVADHSQLDVAVQLPDGKVCFPWVSAWRDFKTSRWLGWSIHPEAPNSDHVFETFRLAVLEAGLPEYVYLDNGKDFRTKDFAGGRANHRLQVDETRAGSMLGMLGVVAHFALPYGAQSKPIERDFLKTKELFSKHMIGYRGGNVVERPEILAQEIKRGEIIAFEDMEGMFDDYVRNVLNMLPSQGQVLKGRSPEQAWAEEFTMKRTVSEDALALFCTRTSRDVTIGRNGVRDGELQVNYWGEWMSGQKGERVYLRRDVKAYQTAWVFRASDDEYLGRATLAHSASALATTDIERRELRQATAAKRRDKKVAEAYAKARTAPDPMEKLSHLKVGTSVLAGYTPRANPKTHVISKTIMDEVVEKDEAMQATGTADLSPFARRPQGNRIFVFESDKEE